MAQITLDGMHFYAFHGCFEEEQRVGTRFEVSCSLDYDALAAASTDDLTKAVDYQQAYALIKREMEIPSHLLEHVAQRMVDALKLAFPQVYRVKVKICKLQPPLGGNIDKVCLCLEG